MNSEEIQVQLDIANTNVQFFINHKLKVPEYLKGFIDGLKFALEPKKS